MKSFLIAVLIVVSMFTLAYAVDKITPEPLRDRVAHNNCVIRNNHRPCMWVPATGKWVPVGDKK